MVTTTWISCNACGADSFKELSEVDGWHIGQCSNCSLIYVNPVPYFEPDAAFSEKSLEFQYTGYMYENLAAVLDFEVSQLQRQFQRVAALMGNGAPAGGGRYLDIGCGSGVSVRAAADLGWEAVGTDLDPELIRLGKEELGVDLRCGHLLDLDLGERQFEFIRLRDVIEHLPNPLEVLLEIKRLLAPKGTLLIVTPNEMGLPTQLRLLFGKRDRVATVVPPHHLHGFTQRTLTRILDRAGFDIHEVDSTTPVDPAYVTSNNMRSAHNIAYSLVWQGAKAINMGSVLFGWAGKREESVQSDNVAGR